MKGNRSKLVADFKKFGDQTTFHGLRYVTNNTYHSVRRLIWLAVVLGMTTWLVINIIRAVVYMFQYPETSSISVNYVPNITFPAVTLCNFNQYRKDALDARAIKILAKVFGNPALRESIDLDVSDVKLFPTTNQANVTATTVQATHQIEDMLVDCHWRTEPCSHLNFTQRLTDYGVCYTFNDDLAGLGDVLTIQNPGASNGLHLRLNIQQDLYTFGESTAAGMKVLLHPQGEFPIMKEFAFSLSPGFETSVAVRKETVTSLKAPYKSDCIDGSLKEFPYKYSVAACQLECRALYVIDKCGCRDIRWPASAEICTISQMASCVHDYEEEFLSRGERCHCPMACETTTYQSKLSLAYWPAGYLTAELQAKRNLTEDFIRKNYIDVYIYFEEIMYMAIEQKMAYTIDNVQSDIGGYLGLLCGMSLITLVEWADFILITLYKRCRRLASRRIST
ncbi:acid-sensing ion channel 1C-like [Acanthaster planci]|uniref:Acid-sensing ion channel 1C-like n=1 Tax=Acanthaster planci TaxID=133434 RepID=A0A8B7ZDX3_ACAPL|nr:acid-sensing ion channel 1C-like [Acanthaster planci]